MESEVLAIKFLNFVTNHFIDVRAKPPNVKRPNRVSLYVPNKPRNKRWMQIDWNKESISIAMDHLQGDISEETIRNAGVVYGKLDGRNSRIRLQNDNAVYLTVFKSDMVNFTSDEFLYFLTLHYNSYLRRISRKDLTIGIKS
ncbi:hypothetical protein [Guptibacillus algicola]|uniref:hypothetical protein n=1 Tax=Guptibacillus algicola TaxID=225844 RepID=UPI001CD6A82B|nr:hypothetical protein [Alkalihalobacillus algicola]MCA0986982.1 hypothetical protein [Alkalihalobacillus algicola]